MKNNLVKSFLSVGVLLIFSAGIYWSQHLLMLQAKNPAYYTGWLLFGLLMSLLLFNFRKKFNFLAIVRVKIWAGWHYWVGLLFTVSLFFHINTLFVQGIFEIVLFLVILLTLLSGLLGWYLSKTIPQKLNQRGDAIIFERIPALKNEICHRVEAIIENAIEHHRSIELATFYHEKLAIFLKGHADYRAHLFHSNRPHHQWQNLFDNLRSHLRGEQVQILDDLWAYVDQKIHLDYAHAQLGLLKNWLFIHIPLAFISLVLMLYHLLIVYVFAGQM